MRSIFLKKGNPIFLIKFGQKLPKSFSQLHVKKFKIFPFIILEKRRLAQGIRRPKAVASPLHITNKYGAHYDATLESKMYVKM